MTESKGKKGRNWGIGPNCKMGQGVKDSVILVALWGELTLAGGGGVYPLDQISTPNPLRREPRNRPRWAEVKDVRTGHVFFKQKDICMHPDQVLLFHSNQGGSQGIK